jgi:amino-acid N-acetyltransferase
VNGNQYAQWFRDSTPYISTHRNKTFVVQLEGEALDHPNLTNIVHDLALIHVLGARLVVVHGARPQIDAALPDAEFHHGRRITRAADLPLLLGIFGQQRARLEALFSTGLPTSPLHGTEISVIGGNFVTARPVGVVDGVDHLLTGRTRRIHTQRLRSALSTGALILLSPMGYSPSGQVFNLAADELAADVALALEADKLILFNRDGALTDESGNRLSVMSPAELDSHPASGEAQLSSALRASRGGIRSCQLVSYQEDGALLTELFTATGSGTQIRETFGTFIRSASNEDVASIVEVIRPLEEAGILVRRSPGIVSRRRSITSWSLPSTTTWWDAAPSIHSVIAPSWPAWQCISPIATRPPGTGSSASAAPCWKLPGGGPAKRAPRGCSSSPPRPGTGSSIGDSWMPRSTSFRLRSRPCITINATPG